MQTADICDFLCLLNIKMQANLQVTLNTQKLEVFRLQGALPL